MPRNSTKVPVESNAAKIFVIEPSEEEPKTKSMTIETRIPIMMAKILNMIAPEKIFMMALF